MVFYFSATGNTKYAATKVQEAFGGELIKIDDAVRRKEFNYKAEDGEKVFIVMPTYFFSMPTLVETFLENVNFENEVEVCGIFTCGGSIGGADRLFRDALKGKNCQVKAVYKVKMVDNYILMFKIPSKDEQVMIMRRAEKEIENIIENIKFNYRVGYESAFPMKAVSKLMNKIYKATNKTKKFTVDDKCVTCGLCNFHCPVAAIKMQNRRPTWSKEECVHCLACIHRCPAQAIEYGNKTQNKGRYVNPILK